MAGWDGDGVPADGQPVGEEDADGDGLPLGEGEVDASALGLQLPLAFGEALSVGQ